MSDLDSFLAAPEIQAEEPRKELADQIQYNVAFYGSWFPEATAQEFSEAEARLASRKSEAGPVFMGMAAVWAPDERRYVDWIAARMQRWNAQAEAQRDGSPALKRELADNLAIASVWEERLSKESEKTVRPLFQRADTLLNRKNFHWDRESGASYSAFAGIGRMLEDALLRGQVDHLAGGSSSAFQLTKALFEKSPAEVLSILSEQHVFYAELPKAWQEKMWAFFNQHRAELSPKEAYWNALRNFLQHQPQYVDTFIEQHETWIALLPVEHDRYDYDADAATPYEVLNLYNSLVDDNLIPKQHKVRVYHYLVSVYNVDASVKPDYLKLADSQALEEKFVGEYLTQRASKKDECYHRCDIGKVLFQRKTKAWGTTKTIAFVKRILPKELHPLLALSFASLRLFLDQDPKEVERFLGELQNPEKRDLDAVQHDPLWKEIWDLWNHNYVDSFLPDHFNASDRYGFALGTLPAYFLKIGRGDIVQKFWKEHHPYAPLFQMPADIRPTGKGLGFVSIDDFVDPARLPHADKAWAKSLFLATSPWSGSRSDAATHGVQTSALAVGERFGLAPKASLYAAPVDFKKERLPETLVRNLEQVLIRKRFDDSIAVVGMSFGLSVPHVFHDEAKKSPVFQKLKSLTNDLHEQGVALVAASGNDGSHDLINMVGFLPGVHLIGATNNRYTTTLSDDVRASYTTGGDEENKVRFFTHADPTLLPTSKENMEWEAHSGTSFAQPNFSGILLLMKEVNPTLSWDEQTNILEGTRKRGATKNLRGEDIEPIFVVDPLEALATVAQLPGSTYQGDRLKKFLEHLTR
ncbi:MAG: S8/S53 family peptidase [Deltaproteobacteria bacterium]|nr:S8/S53 family peptidase [Deltaproteobacteria bacterium]